LELNPLHDIVEAYDDAQRARQQVDQYLSSQVGSYITYAFNKIPVVSTVVGLGIDVYDSTSSLGKAVIHGCFGANGSSEICVQIIQQGVSSSENLLKDSVLAIPRTFFQVAGDIYSFGSLILQSVPLDPGTITRSGTSPAARAPSTQLCN
jgi:hypothetical protein